MHKPGLAARAKACRIIWDLRWHGENQSIAATGHNLDIPLTRCPLCQGYWSQHHILRTCRPLASTRIAASISISHTIGSLPDGPARSLAKAYSSLLFPPRDLPSTGQLWTGLWSPARRALLTEPLRHCSIKDARRILYTIGRLAVAHCIQA